MEALFGLFDNPLVLYGGGALVAIFILQKFVLPRISGRGTGFRLPDGDAILGKILGPRFADAKLERAVAAAKKSRARWAPDDCTRTPASSRRPSTCISRGRS